MRARRLSIVVCAVLWVGRGAPARADVFHEFTGTRSIAMGGAHRGLGSSNETLWLNPAGMAMTKRYSMALQYGYGTTDRLSHANISAVDSKSGPVAGGVAYTRDWGNPSDVNPTLNRLYAGTAMTLGEVFAVGLGATNIRGDYRMAGETQHVDVYNGTLGAGLTLGDVFGLGVVYQNVLDREPDLLPSTFGVGVALHSLAAALAADMTVDLRKGVRERLSWHVGGEYFAMQLVAIRLGYRRAADDPEGRGQPRHFVSGGLGLVNAAGAFGVATERQLQGPGRWTLLGNLEFFL